MGAFFSWAGDFQSEPRQIDDVAPKDEVVAIAPAPGDSGETPVYAPPTAVQWIWR